MGEIQRGSNKGMRSPSPEIEEEMDEQTKQHSTYPQVTSTRIKHLREEKKGGSRKKYKATKTSLDPITLTEGDLYDIGDTVRDVTIEALQQFEEQQKIILGVIQIGLQELQTHALQAVTTSTNLASGTSKATEMLSTKASNAIVLPDGALTMENEANRPNVSTLNGVGLNLVVLPGQVIHLLQDGVIAELRAHEHHTLLVISEQWINNEQMALQRDSTITTLIEATNQNKHIMQVIEEACQMVPPLAIEVHICKLDTGVRNARTKMVRVQLELNLQIIDLQLKAQPSTSP